MAWLRELFPLHLQFGKKHSQYSYCTVNTVNLDPSLPIRIATASWAFCLTAKTRCQRDSTDLQTLSPLKTIHAIMCTFFFSQLLQEQRQRQLECKHRDGSLITFAKTELHLSPFAAILLCCTPAKSDSMHTSSIIHLSPKTLNASQLFSLKFTNPLHLPLSAPLPSLNEHSWFLTGFYCCYINNILGYNAICCAREKQLLKMQSLPHQ